MEKWRRYLFPFFTLLVFFLLDGLIAAFFNEALHFNMGYAVPRLTLICLVVFSFHLGGTNLFVQTVIFGLAYDAFYSGVLGVHLASFCLIAYFVYQLKIYFQPGWISYLFLGVIMILFKEFFAFSALKIIGFVSSSYRYFWSNRVAGTLLLNFVFMLILIPFLKRLANYLTD